MAVTKGHGNPDWTRDETLLALELYFDLGGQIPSPTDSRVRALSTLLRSMPFHRDAAVRPSFRNQDGVGFKLQNIRQVATGRGLGNVSRTDRAIWEEFGSRPDEVRRLSKAIRAGLAQFPLAEILPEDEEFREGRILTAIHLRRERNPRLRSALLKSRSASGLSCDMCGHHRPNLPASLHEALFEAHHVLPLAETGEGATRLRDVALLCACCHRMIHRIIATERRWIGIAEARGHIGRAP